MSFGKSEETDERVGDPNIEFLRVEKESTVMASKTAMPFCMVFENCLSALDRKMYTDHVCA